MVKIIIGILPNTLVNLKVYKIYWACTKYIKCVQNISKGFKSLFVEVDGLGISLKSFPDNEISVSFIHK